MNGFKVGDIIIGNASNHYGVTGKHTRCKVVSEAVNKGVKGDRDIRVQVLEGQHMGTTWDVVSSKFNLVVTSGQVDIVVKKKSERISDKYTVEYDSKLDVSFIRIGDVTIAIPLRPEKLAFSVKSPEDENNELIAKSVAYFRLAKGDK
jgi:hypothetical protein